MKSTILPPPPRDTEETMDPEENWQRQMRLRRLRMKRPLTGHELDTLMELEEALDEWCRRGGFLPSIFEEISEK